MSAVVAEGYRRAERICATHGRTYHLASRLLPPERRRAVHALYGFARTADDIVDGLATRADDRLPRLELLFTGLTAARTGTAIDPRLPGGVAGLLAALADSADRFAMDAALFTAFEHSMRMDLPTAPEFTSRYRDMAQLREYTHGSAAVIGLLLLPVLGADPDDEQTSHGAAMLGEAFQLTNFLRDVGEDLDRDRIYLPAADLSAFGVDEEHLRECRDQRLVSAPLRRALVHLIAVNRDWYRQAEAGIAALPRRTRPAIRAAARSYADILRVIESTDHNVFTTRAVVPRRRRIVHATASLR